jgi:iron-regulated transporter 1
MNSQMRRIDLICKILGPLFIALIDGLSTTTSIVVIFVMNVSSLVVEYHAIALVYHDIPELQESKEKVPLAVAELSMNHSSHTSRTPRSHKWGIGHFIHLRALVHRYGNDFSFYFHHRVFLPSISGAILYLTALSFGGQMITYLLSSEYKFTHVGIARTVGVVLEVMATWLAPWLIDHIGPVKAGLWMSLWQLTMLSAGTIVFFVAGPDPTIPVGGLVIGVILSRLGLVGFSLCIQIIVQRVGSLLRCSTSAYVN